MSTPIITIENISRAPRGPVTIHLDHEVYCAQAGDCACPRQKRSRVDIDAAKRRTVVALENQRFPRAITLNAPGTPGSTAELHRAVLETPDGIRLLAARQIRVKVAPAPAEATPAPAPAEKPAAPAEKKPPARKADAPPAPTQGG